MRSPSRRRGIANVVAAVMMLSMIFTVGTTYFLVVNNTNQQYVGSLANRSNTLPGIIGENLQVTTALLTNNHIAFYVNVTAGLNINITAALVLSSTGSVLQCDGRGLPAGSGCSNTTPALPMIVNAGRGSPTIDTGYTYVIGTTDTVKVVTARGNAFSATWPTTLPGYASVAQAIGPVTASLGTFKWLQPTGSMQSGKAVGGYPTVAISPFTSSVVPITLTNTQALATPTTFQQKVTWSPLTYQSYEASDLGNVRFCADSGCVTMLYAWLESCTPSCIPTASSASAWVKLTSSIAGSGGTLVIYMSFQTTSTEFDTTYWGEAPTISATYGVFDNGASTFNFYDNFAGTALNSKWTSIKSSGGSVTVNNGATFTTSGSSHYSFVASAVQAYPQVAESYMVSSGSGSPILGVSTSQSVFVPAGSPNYVPVTLTNSQTQPSSITYRSSTTATGTNSFTINKPTGVVQGDLLIVSIEAGYIGTTWPSGWTQLWSATSSNEDTRGAYHVAGASEPTSYTFSENTASGFVVAVLEAYSGVDSTTPIDVTTPTPIVGSVATITYPSITTVTNNAWHLAISLEEDKTSGTTAVPSGYTQRDRFDVAGQAGILIGTKPISPAGTVSVTTTDSNSTPLWWAVSVALRPAGALALDGYTSASSTTSVTLSLTTTKSPDILYLSAIIAGFTGEGISSITSTPSLTWTERAIVAFNGGSWQDETWYAIWTSSGTISITVNFNGPGTDAVVAFGVSGADTSSPFDTNAAIPSSASGSGTTASVTISTSSGNDFIIGALAVAGNPALTVGSSFSLIATQTGGSARQASDEYKIVASTQTNLAVSYSWTGTQAWGIIADAIRAPGITLVNSATSTVNSDTSGHVTISFTIGTGTNRLLIVGGTVDNSAITGVTYAGTALTQAVADTQKPFASIWYLVNPPSGTANVVVTSTASKGAVIGVISFNGVDQTSPIPTTAKNDNAGGFTSPATVSITNANANAWVMDVVGIGNTGSLTNTASTTTRWNVAGASAVHGASSTAGSLAGSTTTNFSWTLGTADTWDDIAVEIKPAPGGTSPLNTPNPFQQKIVFNPSTYSSYEASNLGNIRFCVDSACVTTLYAWLESCTPSCIPTATSATVWVKLTSSIPGGGGTLTIYMDFYSLTTNFDGVYWGEAPNLSGTYGQYDNGANVFTFYDSFIGTTLNTSKWTTVKSAGGSVAVNNGATFTTAASSDWVFIAAAQIAYPAVAESYVVSVTSSGDVMVGVTTSYSANGWQALYNGYDLDWYGSPLYLEAQTSAGETTVSSTSESFQAGIWQIIWSATGAESGTDGVVTLTGTSSSPSIGNYGIYMGISSSSAHSWVDRWGRMRAYPPNNVMPSVSFGTLSGGGGGGTSSLYNGYSLNRAGTTESYSVSTSSGMTVLSSQTISNFPAGIWQVIWSATGSEYFYDGGEGNYTGTDSSVVIANYGIYVGQTSYAAGSNVVQWARMRADPPNNVMPSASLGTLSLSTSGNVIFSVSFTNADPQRRGVTLWPDSSLTTITTVTGTQSQSVVVTYYIVDGLNLNVNGYPTGVISYNSTMPFIRLPYGIPTTVYFGATTAMGSSMNAISTQTNPLQMLFTLSGQFDDKTLYGQTVPFPGGMGTKASASLSAYSGGTGATITVNGNTFAPSIRSFVGWIDSTGKTTTVKTFTTSPTGGVSNVTFQVPTGTPGYYTIIVSDYTNSAFVTFQHT